MAPSLEEPFYDTYDTHIKTVPANKVAHDLPLKPLSPEGELHKKGILTQSLDYEPGRGPVEDHNNYEHEDLRPSFPDIHWDPLEEVPYHDKGCLGDPNFRSLLLAGATITDLVPKIGSVIEGVRLTQLTDVQKNDLARLIATRGVVFFKNQHDFDIEAHRKFGSYYGTLHKVSESALRRYIWLTLSSSMPLHPFLAGQALKMSMLSSLATNQWINGPFSRQPFSGTLMLVSNVRPVNQDEC